MKHSEGVWGVKLSLHLANFNPQYPAGSDGDATNNLAIKDYLLKFDGADRIDILPSFSSKDGALTIANPCRYTLNKVDGVTHENFASEKVADFGVISANWTKSALPLIESIRIKTKPAKLEYISGEALDLGGLELEAVMDDESVNTDIDASKITTEGYDRFAGAGKQTVAVNYETKSATFEITMSSNGITALDVTPPANTHLVSGQKINPNMMKVSAAKESGSVELKPDSYELKYDNTAGRQTVSVRANGITETFDARFYSTPAGKISFLGVSNVSRLLQGSTPYTAFSILFDGKLASSADGSENGLWSKVDTAEYRGIYEGIKINGRTLKEIQKINNNGHVPDNVNPIKDSSLEYYGGNVWGVKIEMAAMNYSKEAPADGGGYSITDHFLKFDGTDTIEVTSTFSNAFSSGMLTIYNPGTFTLLEDPVTKVDGGATQDEMFPNWLKPDTFELKYNWTSDQSPIVVLDDLEVEINKTEYVQGQSFDSDSITSVKAVMSDGSKADVALSEIEVSGFSSVSVGNCTLKVSYGGIIKEIEITIIDKVVDDKPGDDTPADDKPAKKGCGSVAAASTAVAATALICLPLAFLLLSKKKSKKS